MGAPNTVAFSDLTGPQLEMWFAQQVEPDNPLFDSRAYVDIQGEIDIETFFQAVRRFVDEADVLHLRFTETAAGPVQYLDTTRACAVAFVDVSERADPDAAAWQMMQEASSSLFNLIAGPTFTQQLFKLGHAHYIWYQRYHHIAMDGASVPIAIRRVMQIYGALTSGQAVPLAEFGGLDTMLQSDQAYRRSARHEVDRLYWLDYVARLPWPQTVCGAPAEGSGAFNRASAPLPPALAGRLAASGENASRWPQLLTAIVAAYLFRVSDSRVTVFDFPVAARPKEARAMPGMFANVLPLQLHLSPRSTVAELSRQVGAEVFKHVKHQQFRGKDIKQMRGLEAGPIFGPRINIIPFEDEWDFAGSPATSHSLANGLVHDLAITVIGTPGKAGCMLHVDGNATLYDARALDAHKQRLLHFIDTALAAPERPIEEIELVDAEERQLLLETWNATHAPYPAHLCIHQRFEEQVRRTPQATAVLAGETALSYAELNARANRLAHHLVDLGVVPDSPVAVCMQRHADWLVALLAILKAGGAYLPLDPAYPHARLAHLLDDAAPHVVIVDSTGRLALADTWRIRHADRPPEPSDTPTLIELDTQPAAWAHQPDSNPEPRSLGLASHHLAYLVYTSGSTGTPKGVMVEHRQLGNLVSWHIARFALAPGMLVPCTAGLAFDACTWEIWPALLAGASLVLPPARLAGDTLALLQWWRAQPFDSAFLVTPLALLAMQTGLPPSLSALLLGGDRLTALPANLPDSLRIVNNYGPTETTVVATSGIVSPNDAVFSIGKPIANTRIYLLDEARQPVPIGAVGELYIGGVGVARGYLNRPELTAERFLPDPFERAKGNADARMYRTGDLARYLPDGNIVFLGRNDEQIKIRGFRIEPAEIEAQLAAHPGVREAVVIARGHEHGEDEKRLVAYVTLKHAAEHHVDYPRAEAAAEFPQLLRSYLQTRLPEHMVPAAFVMLDALPLTPNGKLDRKALPAPDDDALANARYEPPSGEIEIALASLWAELLGLPRVGRHDNFFALGGHSLLAVQLIERLRRRGIGLAIKDLFQHPTLSGLATRLAQPFEVPVPPNAIAPNAPAITPAMLPLIDLAQDGIDRIVATVPGGVGNVQDIYALSPLQDGILFHHLLDPGNDPYLLRGHLLFDDRDTLERYLEVMQALVARHDILRTAFVWDTLDAPAQVVWRHARTPVMEPALDPAGGPIAEQLMWRFDTQRYRMDLTLAPLLHFAIAEEPGRGWHAVMLLHHLVGDHTTLAVLHSEVQAFMTGAGASLPAPLPYRHLVAQARLGMPDEEHDAFFRAMLQDVSVPTHPFGIARIERSAPAIGEARLALPASLDERLRAHARRLGVSLAAICHLSWAVVLSRVSATRQVVFGTVLFGRMTAGAGADRTMGLYINTLPLRLDVGDTQVEQAIRETQLQLAALLAHEHASLALAQRCSAVPPNVPLFGALLNYRHDASPSDGRFVVPGMTFLGGHERTHYPLVLSIEDDGASLTLAVQAAESISPERVGAYMAQSLAQLADALDGAAPATLDRLSVVPEHERHLLLDAWNATDAEFPERSCLHQLFEAQAERAPDAIAVIDGERSCSYGELNARANQLAHHLIQCGVVPDARVAICLQRGLHMVVGLLAILKAGGAYVPLDPGYPPARLAHILRDAAPTMLLVDRHGQHALADALEALQADSSTPTDIVDLERHASAWGPANPPPTPTP